MRKFVIITLVLSSIAIYLWHDSRSFAIGEWQTISYSGEVEDNIAIYSNGKALYYHSPCTWESVGDHKLLIVCDKIGHQLSMTGKNEAKLDGMVIYRKGHVPPEEVSKVISKGMEEALSRSRNQYSPPAYATMPADAAAPPPILLSPLPADAAPPMKMLIPNFPSVQESSRNNSSISSEVKPSENAKYLQGPDIMITAIKLTEINNCNDPSVLIVQAPSDYSRAFDITCQDQSVFLIRCKNDDGCYLLDHIKVNR
jgi:hypothetical protein